MRGRNYRSEGSGSLPLQTKEITVCDIMKFIELSIGTPLEAVMRETARVLIDVVRYSRVPPPELYKSTCTLSQPQVEFLFRIGHWVLLADDEIDNIKGVLKIFTIDELFKVPPRARVISWAWSVNQDLSFAIPIDMFKQCKVRFLVWKGSHLAVADGKAAFNQYEYSYPVSMYHCVKTCLGWARATRACMGARGSVAVTDTSLRVLACPTVVESFPVSYVDNLGLFGVPTELRKDIATVRNRAEFTGYTFNEDLSDPDKLIATQGEFLGVILNMTTKEVALADKVLAKLGLCWTRRAEWDVHDMIVCVCTLVYGSNVLGRRMSRYQLALQVWARLQSLCMADPELMKKSYDGFEGDEILAEWVLLTLMNDPVPVSNPDQLEHDFILVTDAMVKRWGAILISTKSGQCTTMSGEWPEKYHEMLKASTTSEPLAVAAAMETFFEPHAKARVLHLGDNTPTTGEVTKGYSTTEGRFLAAHIATKFPLITLDSEYYEGEFIPTDELSRDRPLNHGKLDRLAQERSVVITDIRELHV